jgi:hypothetical protein
MYFLFTIPLVIFIALVASLNAYFRRKDDVYLRLFPFFLFLTLLVESASLFGLIRGDANHAMYNFFSVLEFTFYLFVVGEIIRNTRIKRLVRYTIWLYGLLALVNIIFYQKIYGFPSLTYMIGAFLIVVICIYYFFELFQISHSVTLVRQPAFWICSGLLFFYCCSFPIFASMNLTKTLPPFIFRNFGVIVNILNVLLYSSFTIAFVCRLRTRKSIS